MLPYYKIALTEDGKDTVARAVASAMLKAFINNSDASINDKVYAMDFDIAGTVTTHNAFYKWIEKKLINS